jgi:hypothetical protein
MYLYEERRGIESFEEMSEIDLYTEGNVIDLQE